MNMRKKMLHVACFSSLGMVCGNCAGAESVKLVSYNIQIGRGMDKVYDLNRTAETLRRTGAETIVLNEVDVGTDRSNGVDQAAFLAGKLNLNHVFGRASDRPGGTYGNAVLSVHKAEKLDLIDLPAPARESRSALVVKIHAPRPYYIIAAHLTEGNNTAEADMRRQSIDLLADYLQKKKLFPSVLCGDLNADFNSPVIQRLQERGFLVANDLSGKMLSWPADNPRVLIDYFCVYPADAAEVIDFKVLDERASDHRPVQTELKFRPMSLYRETNAEK